MILRSRGSTTAAKRAHSEQNAAMAFARWGASAVAASLGALRSALKTAAPLRSRRSRTVEQPTSCPGVSLRKRCRAKSNLASSSRPAHKDLATRACRRRACLLILFPGDEPRSRRRMEKKKKSGNDLPRPDHCFWREDGVSWPSSRIRAQYVLPDASKRVLDDVLVQNEFRSSTDNTLRTHAVVPRHAAGDRPV